MLRQWNGESLEPITHIIKQFDLTANRINLLKYESLSPDSCIWVFGLDDKRFCLYAEDYVPSLQHVLDAMATHGVINDEDEDYKLLQVKKLGDWDKSTPVSTATVYKPPADPKKFMEFATTSGHDFVFLGESTKNKLR
ncbi:MAG: hypothetical protein JWS12_503 [Candidatus Saccharibacteria bacterium]|nr:hypothetical protein [Candidatus Saccharibacteria bacterium]